MNEAKKFIESILIREDPYLGHVHISLRPFQEILLNRIEEKKFILVEKPRQLGVTSVVCWKAIQLAEKGKHCLIVVPTSIAQTELLKSKIKPAIKNFSKSRQERILQNINVVFSTDKIRGKCYDFVYFDEADHYSNLSPLFNAAVPTLNESGCFLVSVCKDSSVRNFKESTHSSWHEIEISEDGSWREKQGKQYKLFFEEAFKKKYTWLFECGNFPNWLIQSINNIGHNRYEITCVLLQEHVNSLMQLKKELERTKKFEIRFANGHVWKFMVSEIENVSPFVTLDYSLDEVAVGKITVVAHYV